MTTIIETLRHPKVFGIAVLDLAGTGAIAVLMAVAIIVHYALGVPTQLNYYIHLNDRVR